MGGLRPIGSEKLQGTDKLRRIMEIARYNENKPNPINETKSDVYSLRLSDGNTYNIVKERQGYIIKESFNGEQHYIDTIQERKYYNSYSQALKRLNLMAKEMNSLYGNKKGTALFEQSNKDEFDSEDGEKKKYYLDLSDLKKEKKSKEPLEEQGTTPPQPADPNALTPQPADPNMSPPTNNPAPDSLNTGGAMGPGDMGSGDMGPGDMGSGDMGPGDMGPGDTGPGDMESGMEPENEKKGEITFKLIQKLTGKLAQKLRKFGEKEEMSSDDIKYVINSIISAIDIEALDEDDIEEIINRLEGEEIEDEEDIDSEDEMGGMGPEPGLEGPPPSPEETPKPTGGEMAEGYKNFGDAFKEKFESAYTSVLADKMMENERRNGRKNRHFYKHFEHGTFGESTVDNIISSYFDIKEDEYLIKEEKIIKKINEIKKINKEEIKRLSESLKQERMALKFIEKYPKATIVGSTVNKNLIFKNGINETKISIDGKIL